MVRHHHFDRAHIDRAAVLDDFTVAAQKTETLGDGCAAWCAAGPVLLQVGGTFVVPTGAV